MSDHPVTILLRSSISSSPVLELSNRDTLHSERESERVKVTQRERESERERERESERERERESESEREKTRGEEFRE